MSTPTHALHGEGFTVEEADEVYRSQPDFPMSAAERRAWSESLADLTTRLRAEGMFQEIVPVVAPAEPSPQVEPLLQPGAEGR